MANNFGLHCRYYTDNVLRWSMGNKMIVFLGLLSFCLFVSTLAMSSQRNAARQELADLRESVNQPTTIQPDSTDTSPTQDSTSDATTDETNTSEVPTSETPTSETPTSETPTSETPTSDTPTSEITTVRPPVEGEGGGTGDDASEDRPSSLVNRKLMRLMRYAES